MKGHLIIVALCLSLSSVLTGVGNSESMVVAEAEGEQGSIRVEERNGMRFLTIDNVMQGGIPIGLDAAQRFIDPMVELIRAVRPKAGTALVIGLGTGKTAGDLSSVGFSVETVELEPAVIDFARRYFGYRGPVVKADGLEYLKKTKNHYDVILMDAFSGEEAPAHLVSKEAFVLMRDCLSSEDGIIGVRLLSFPDDPKVRKILSAMGVNAKQIFGSGIGPEKQNLYILGSQKIMSIANVSKTLPLPVTSPNFNVLLPGRRRLDFQGKMETKNTDREATSRKVTILGYLIRVRETNNICIDLPHHDMGAVRYLIVGDLLSKFDELLDKGTFFLRDGEITSRNDQRLQQTLSGLLGVSGVRGSSTIYSPVIVVVEGIVHLRSLDLDVLYELNVSKVLMSLDYKSWEKFRHETLKPIIRWVEYTFITNDIEKAAEAIGDYLKAMDARLNGFGIRCKAYNDIARFKRVLDIEKVKLGKQASAFEIAAACDWAERFVRGVWYNEDAKIVRRVIRECAERNYAKVASNPKDPNALKAAARLSYLLMERSDELKTQADMLEIRVSELKTLYKGIEPANRTPGGEERAKELEKHFQKE